MKLRSLIVVGMLAVPLRAGAQAQAPAQVCVRLDEQRDTLSVEDRRAATISLSQALQKNNQQVVAQGCSGTYTVYHVKLGNTISVYLYGPTGAYREARANKLDELPLVYEQLVRAIVTGQAMASGGDTVDRTNATSDQMVPRRVAADDLKYLRLGYGTVTGGALVGGPAFGFGWRHELDRIGIDISIFDLIISSDNRTRDLGVTGSFVQLRVLYFFDPLSNSTAYLGGGLNWGATAVTDGGVGYTGSGLQGAASLGYEMLRSSTIRLFVEANATLPFFKSEDLTSTATRYTPSFNLCFGTGFGHANTIGVVNR